MNDLSCTLTSPPQRVVVSSSADVLPRIAERDVVASIWRRPVEEGVAARLAPRLPRRTSENGVLVWSHDYRSRSLEPLVAGLPLGEDGEAILDDVRTLLQRWYETATVAHAFVALAAVADPGCHRLHVDRVGRRLVCTYVGTATEWLEPEAAAAWRRDPCCYEPTQIRRLGTGEVMVMKGCFDADEGGLVHRAPPWIPDSNPRLLLRICDGEYHVRRMLAEHPSLSSSSPS